MYHLSPGLALRNLHPENAAMRSLVLWELHEPSLQGRQTTADLPDVQDRPRNSNQTRFGQPHQELLPTLTDWVPCQVPGVAKAEIAWEGETGKGSARQQKGFASEQAIVTPPRTHGHGPDQKRVWRRGLWDWGVIAGSGFDNVFDVEKCLGQAWRVVWV